MKTENKELSLIIPCFNEAGNIVSVIKRLQEIISRKDIKNIEIIIVDGASTDSTPAELKKIFQNLDPETFKLILREKRGGYGADIICGINSAKGNILSWTHADMQTDPIDVIKAFDLYNKSENKNIFIKGKRKNRRILEAFFTFGMQIFAFFALKVYMSDINAQPKMFSREFYEKYLKNNHPDDFSLDLDALYKAKINGYKILTIPVFFAKRTLGKAKGGGGGWKSRIKLITRTIKYILKLRKNYEI